MIPNEREWFDLSDDMTRKDAEKMSEERRRMNQPKTSSYPSSSNLSDLFDIHRGLVVKVVCIVCATWIICTLINSCSNRYYAIPSNQKILDKRSGTVFSPGAYPTTQGFGEKSENVKH